MPCSSLIPSSTAEQSRSYTRELIYPTSPSAHLREEEEACHTVRALFTKTEVEAVSFQEEEEDLLEPLTYLVVKEASTLTNKLVVAQRLNVPFPLLKKRKNKRSVTAILSLTAMVDMFTVLVIFLLQNYSATGEVLFIPKEEL